MLKKNLDEIFG